MCTDTLVKFSELDVVREQCSNSVEHTECLKHWCKYLSIAAFNVMNATEINAMKAHNAECVSE